ncbi:WD repeat-containing protein 62, partial [Pleurodeles waltl]|uniref:WD repeat-containing protein 62 n=1 Tax=Pleurodeles waltl TaxID=8319 RepID=UPI0037096C2A
TTTGCGGVPASEVWLLHLDGTEDQHKGHCNSPILIARLLLLLFSVVHKVKLKTVLGITSTSNSSFTCDVNTGVIAYFAGCVIVLFCPKKNKQTHIFNNSRKPLRALSFSPDGKYIVTGESGSRPAVRVWDKEEKTQVAELLGHKYGVSCVAFSPNSKYIVSVGYHHDMLVNLWDWKKETVVAKNKVSNKVLGVSFSEDSSYFVTVGNRHVKFWYLDASKEFQVNSTVPLVGRSGLLGELHNNTFCGVTCGKGKLAGRTFCISHSGLLCQFNEKRVLEKWIDLKISASHCLSASEEFIFCGCRDGTVRIFNPLNLQYVTNLPKPHSLGTDIAKGVDPSVLFTKRPDSQYPDTIAVAYDPSNQWVSCVYNDHSLYVWDVKETKKIGKVCSALCHSSHIWNVEVYPELEDDKACLPKGSFLTCSSDGTIRIWTLDRGAVPELQRNIYSHEVQKILYVDHNLQRLKDAANSTDKLENEACGIRVIQISPDGQHLASGDKGGNIRIHDLKLMDEFLKIEAHDGEVLCLEYSKTQAGVTFLASASRDRLIHVFNVEKGYILEETLDDHSSSITAVKFACRDSQVQLISCGADKSIYFRNSEQIPEGNNFSRTHHLVEKTTLYDMDTDVTQKYVAVACQDRNVRIYNVRKGKLKTLFKGSQNEDGSLLKVEMDPSGTFIATSCSDKNIALFDLFSGECVATMFGHSEIVTGMKFTHDYKHLITVSADSCIFVWRLGQQLTKCMKDQAEEVNQLEKQRKAKKEKCAAQIRRETLIVPPDFIPPSNEEDVGKEAEDDSEDDSDNYDDDSLQTPPKESIDTDPTFLLTNGRLPMWAKTQGRESNNTFFDLPLVSRKKYMPCGRWAERANRDLIKSILDSKEDNYCLTPTITKASVFNENEDDLLEEERSFEKMQPENLEHQLKMQNAAGTCSILHDSESSSSISSEDMLTNQEVDSPDTSEFILYPTLSDESSLGTDSGYHVLVAHSKYVCDEKGDGCVPDSHPANVDHPHQDEDSLGSDWNSELGVTNLDEKSEHTASFPQTPEDDQFVKHNFETLSDYLSEERFDGSLKDLKPIEDDEKEVSNNPRLSISARFISHCQESGRLARKSLPKQMQLLKTGEAPGHIPEGSKININSRRRTDKTLGKMTADLTMKTDSKGSNQKEISITIGTCRKLPLTSSKMPEIDKITRRSSLQTPCIPRVIPTGRASTGSSYMIATTSSHAKMWRSRSVGENINTKNICLNAKLQESGMIRPSSSTDLSLFGKESYGQAGVALSDKYRENNPLNITRHTIPSSGNNEERANLALNIRKAVRDKILMPPPSMPNHDAFQVTKKSPSSNIKELKKTQLSFVTPAEIKSLDRDEQNMKLGLEYSKMVNSVCLCGERELAEHEVEPFKLALSPASYLKDTNQRHNMRGHLSETTDETNVNTSLADCIVSKSPLKKKEMENISSEYSSQVTIARCEMIVEDLQNTFQKALQIYNEVTSCADIGCVQEQLQKKSIFTKAFFSIQSQLDAFGFDHDIDPQNSDELNSLVQEMKNSKENAIAGLQCYYELILKMMQKNIHR